MRLPRLRFTVRRLMLVVAIAGLIMGGGVSGHRMWELSRYYAGHAQSSKAQERYCRGSADLYMYAAQRTEETARLLTAVVSTRGLARKSLRSEGYSDESVQWRAVGLRKLAADRASKAVELGAQARKYDRAARYPWLPVEPDRPEP
jgi:hypothetical protein